MSNNINENDFEMSAIIPCREDEILDICLEVEKETKKIE